MSKLISTNLALVDQYYRESLQLEFTNLELMVEVQCSLMLNFSSQVDSNLEDSVMSKHLQPNALNQELSFDFLPNLSLLSLFCPRQHS